MDGKSGEYITNFWSHFPDGLTFIELMRITPEQTAAYQAAPAARLIVESEVAMQLVPEAVAVSEHIAAA